MKKIVFLAVVLVIAGSLWLIAQYIPKKTSDRIQKISKVAAPTMAQEQTPPGSRSIFVPYWAVDEAIDYSSYDILHYFGVSANTNGIITIDEGYRNIETFLENTPSTKKRFLVLRLLDSTVNFAILKDVKIQKKIITETIALSKEKGFDGVVLDLELTSYFNPDIKDQISSFVQLIFTNIKQQNQTLLLAIYGDVYYRKRPFDMKFLGENSHGILVMAYDLHKAAGEPGPNFPLSGQDIYGYDMKRMVADFTKDVAAERLTIIFGMYGYDWTVDEKKRPIKPGKALSLIDMKASFIEKCEWKSCTVRRDELSKETEVNYITDYLDDNPVTNPEKFVSIIYHIVWFEDEQSVEKKLTYLKSQGITNYSYWTAGYF